MKRTGPDADEAARPDRKDGKRQLQPRPLRGGKRRIRAPNGPIGVDGAAIFSAVAPEAPTSESAWKFEANVTRMRVDVVFPASVAPGSKVWFTAFWYNSKAERGPAAAAVGTNLPGGSAMAA